MGFLTESSAGIPLLEILALFGILFVVSLLHRSTYNKPARNLIQGTVALFVQTSPQMSTLRQVMLDLQL